MMIELRDWFGFSNQKSEIINQKIACSYR